MPRTGRSTCRRLREAELREVVSQPAALLSARFETDGLAADIARRTAEESAKDAGALPLLSYLLDDMWTQMVKRGDGVLRLPPAAIELGGVLAERANAFLATHPTAEEALRRMLTLKLATVREDERADAAAGAALRVHRRGMAAGLRACRSSRTACWSRRRPRAARPTRRWRTRRSSGAGRSCATGSLREREFLAWRTGLEAARRAWQATPDSSKNDALLMGAALTQAQSWLAKRRRDLPVIDQDFIDQSRTSAKGRREARARRLRALVYVLLVGIITGLVGWINQAYVKEQWNWYMTMRPYMLANVDLYVLV